MSIFLALDNQGLPVPEEEKENAHPNTAGEAGGEHNSEN
jgi:hypothetical protein